MKTTHVGSLPFDNIEDALNYTFRFDVPVIFTLPNLNKKDFIHLEVIDLLDCGSFKDGKIDLDLNRNSKSIKLRYEEEFLKRFNRSEKKVFKIQLIGPVSLYSLSNHNYSLQEVSDFLIEKYSELSQRLNKFGDLFFCIDEPLLNKTVLNKVKIINSFLKSLPMPKELVGIHSCCKLPVEEINKIECSNMNLDCSLYSIEELNSIDQFSFPGGLNKILLNNHCAKISCINLEKINYLSPSCGLYYESLNSLDRIFNELGETKNKVHHLLEQNLLKS